MISSRIGMSLLIASLALFALPGMAQQSAVVVELFTSEGCSSCPPADSLITALSRQTVAGQPELILLSEHVEYWNTPKWTDRFSSPIYTQRQEDYIRHLHLATAYTPQIVVDGQLQASGGNPAAVRRIITQAATTPMPASVTLRPVSPEAVQVRVEHSGQAKQRVLFAVTEDDLTSNVRGGENEGRTLTHTAVVRDLYAVGNTSNGAFEKTIKIPAKSDWRKQNLHAIVLVQDTGSGIIVGAASIPYSTNASTASGQ